MARKTFPRRQEIHELVASEVLRKHEKVTGWSLSMPVPIELVVEQTYGLSVLWSDIDEPTDTIILGALSPKTQTILLNERHATLLEEVVGPLQFTLAHELGHWIYDAENPDQGNLFDDRPDEFCYHRRSSRLTETLRIREVNANKLAAAVLMPASIMKSLDGYEVLDHLRSRAATWGVSQQSLRIRLETLDMIDPDEEPLVAEI